MLFQNIYPVEGRQKSRKQINKSLWHIVLALYVSHFCWSALSAFPGFETKYLSENDIIWTNGPLIHQNQCMYDSGVWLSVWFSKELPCKWPLERSQSHCQTLALTPVRRDSYRTCFPATCAISSHWKWAMMYTKVCTENYLCAGMKLFFLGGGGVGSQYQSHGGGSCASSIYCSIQTTFKCTKKRVAVCHCCPPCVQYMHKVGPNTPMLFRCYVRYMSPTRGLGLGLHCLLTCTGGSGPKLAIHLAVQPM